MTVKLNGRAYEHAKRLIEQGKFVHDDREAWSDHHPPTQIEEEFIKHNGLFEYGKWFLGINDDYIDAGARHYELAHGDFDNVHRCGILATRDRARQERCADVENAAADLLAAIAKRSYRA